MRIAFFQHEDYGPEIKSLIETGAKGNDTQHERATLFHNLSRKAELMAVCTTVGETAHETALDDKTITACVPANVSGKVDHRALIDLLIKWRINYLVLQIPSRALLAWALKKNIRTLPDFATGFDMSTIGDRVNAFRMARLLNHSRVPILGVRNINRSAVFKKMGVKPHKIFPWQWKESDNDNLYVANCDLTWTTLVQRWIDSPRRPAQSIMNKSLDHYLKR